jgi:hypothetical protein
MDPHQKHNTENQNDEQHGPHQQKTQPRGWPQATAMDK